MKYAIYPPIGIARIGNSPNEFFFGPESSNSVGSEITPNGIESPVVSWKDSAYRMKRQAARFQVFEVPDDGSLPRPAQLLEGTTIRWTARIVNKKDAVVRPAGPPPQPAAISLASGRQDRVIDSAVVTIQGANATAVKLAGTYRGGAVPLGEIRTDGEQRLVVLGGPAVSSPSTPTTPIGGDFYNNPDWHDDVGDGPVTALIQFPGQPAVSTAPAWVIVAPPDFAPAARGIVTLYDVILQTAYNAGLATAPTQTFFATDVRPLIERASSLQWVNGNPVWGKVSIDFTKLADPSATNRTTRSANAALIRSVETALQNFSLQDWQNTVLDNWESGNFDPGARPSSGSAAEIARAALDGTVGQGFFPGIEGGIILTNASLYSSPFDFRLNHGKVLPGDITALMALPWQADFLKCAGGWWPAQRPDLAPQTTGAARPWLRPTYTHAQLVQHAMQLGVITPQGATMVEMGRDPVLGS